MQELRGPQQEGVDLFELLAFLRNRFNVFQSESPNTFWSLANKSIKAVLPPRPKYPKCCLHPENESRVHGPVHWAQLQNRQKIGR